MPVHCLCRFLSVDCFLSIAFWIQTMSWGSLSDAAISSISASSISASSISASSISAAMLGADFYERVTRPGCAAARTIFSLLRTRLGSLNCVFIRIELCGTVIPLRFFGFSFSFDCSFSFLSFLVFLLFLFFYFLFFVFCFLFLSLLRPIRFFHFSTFLLFLF